MKARVFNNFIVTEIPAPSTISTTDNNVPTNPPRKKGKQKIVPPH